MATLLIQLLSYAAACRQPGIRHATIQPPSSLIDADIDAAFAFRFRLTDYYVIDYAAFLPY